MSRKKTVWGWGAAGLVFVLLTSGAVILLESTVTVHNQSSAKLTNVHVTMAGQDVWSGVLGPGESQKAYGRPSADGTVGVSFQAAGQSVHQEFGYVTPGLGEHHTIVVLPSLELRYIAQ